MNLIKLTLLLILSISANAATLGWELLPQTNMQFTGTKVYCNSGINEVTIDNSVGVTSNELVAPQFVDGAWTCYMTSFGFALDDPTLLVVESANSESIVFNLESSIVIYAKPNPPGFLNIRN